MYKLSVCRTGYIWALSTFDSLESMRAAYFMAINDHKNVLSANMYGPDGRQVYPYETFTTVHGGRG